MESERRKSSRDVLAPNEPNPNPLSTVEKSHGSSEESPDCPPLNSSVLFSIARLLDTLDDYSSFRRVSQIWRSAASPAPDVLALQHPLMVVELRGGNYKGLYDIVAHRLYRMKCGTDDRILSYAHGFIVTQTYNGITRTDETKLTNIFTNTEICLPLRRGNLFHDVIFSKNPSLPDCLVVSFTLNGPMFQYCRPGDSMWVTHKTKGDHKVFDDMFFFDGRLYALSEGELLLVKLFPDLKITDMGGKATLRKELRKGFDLKIKLAESGGELLLVFFCVIGRSKA